MERVYDPETNGWHYENLTDGFGNAKGGIRTAALDYPTARYYNWCHEPTADGGLRENWLYGHADPFTPAFLQELYGSLDAYRELVAKATLRDVQLGYVLPEDAAELTDEIVENAHRRGLR